MFLYLKNYKYNKVIIDYWGSGQILKLAEMLNIKLELWKMNIYIYKLWTEFINDEKYKNYFLSNEE